MKHLAQLILFSGAIIVAINLLSCSVEPDSDSGDPNPKQLEGHWFRYTVTQSGESWYSSFDILEDGKWFYEIPEYAWAEGTYDVVGKKIYLINPGCAEAIGTYVYVFSNDYAEVDMQVEEDACPRVGFISGMWWRS